MAIGGGRIKTWAEGSAAVTSEGARRGQSKVWKSSHQLLVRHSRRPRQRTPERELWWQCQRAASAEESRRAEALETEAAAAAKVGEQSHGIMTNLLDQYQGDLVQVLKEIEFHHPALASKEVADFVKRGRRGENGSMVSLHHNRHYFMEHCMMPHNYKLEGLERDATEVTGVTALKFE